MAEIRILPLSVLTAERAARLTGDQADAYRAGADLGSRVPHIRAASDGIVRMRGDLQPELAALARTAEKALAGAPGPSGAGRCRP